MQIVDKNTHISVVRGKNNEIWNRLNYNNSTSPILIVLSRFVYYPAHVLHPILPRNLNNHTTCEKGDTTTLLSRRLPNCLRTDIDAIEKVQRRFTKRLHGLKDLSYAERLQCLNIPSSELRRLHLDLLFWYKIMFGLVCVNPGEFFTFSSVFQTRGHPYKLYKTRCTNTVRHNSFIGTVVNVWNALPTTVNFSSLLTFKSSLTNVDFSSYLKYAV